MTGSIPDLVLYTSPGCGLCGEARTAVEILLADRMERGLAVPTVIERNIEQDADLHRQLFERIPVIELGPGRLELATSMARLRRLFADVLDSGGATPATGGAPSLPGRSA
ncbi:MAG: glutaredoxin family protein [Chloroflexi bacterium]|nr:glutaredoxin family protein [Chloroflexota bacterium]